MNAEIRKLEQRQLELEHRLHAIRSDYHRGLDQDSEEQAVQLENMEVLQEIGRLAERELEQIRDRLAELRKA
ncbi:MAG: hypothetical protein V2I57_14375 [Xanthomonadales bacterium]|jgi:hypothetical protein|nr:hypothetical protein [Xanthomonadales bacterium]